MSIFADDKHCFWEINSCQCFERAIAQLQTVLDVIHGRGMEVNTQKSLVTVALKGRQAAKMLKRHFQHWNGCKCLVIRRHQQNDIKIPTASCMTYLGIVLSYANFELATAQHRCSQANAGFQCFQQLKKIMRTNGALSKAQQLKVYIWLSLMYGVSAVGITASSARVLQSTAAQHLRQSFVCMNMATQMLMSCNRQLYLCFRNSVIVWLDRLALLTEIFTDPQRSDSTKRRD